MLGINPMDVPLYVESFQKKGRLVIDNVLETSAAERVGDFLKTMPEDWWFASTLPNRDLNDEMEVHRSDMSHSDDVNGRLAFVYHLTKNWNVSWGGLYVAHNPDGTLSAMPPSFNRLALFTVGSNQTPHCVTPILPGISHSRYSITGWAQ